MKLVRLYDNALFENYASHALIGRIIWHIGTYKADTQDLLENFSIVNFIIIT